LIVFSVVQYCFVPEVIGHKLNPKRGNLMKRHFLVLLPLVLWLAACGSSATPEAGRADTDAADADASALATEATAEAVTTEAAPAATVEPTEAPTEAVAEAPTEAVAEAPTATAAEARGQGEDCTVQPITELLPLAPDLNIPSIQAGDWIKGPDDATITLVEYSDFQ
jgi:hypothetical protein